MAGDKRGTELVATLLEALNAIRDKALLVKPFANPILRGDLDEMIAVADAAIQSAGKLPK